jgi:cytochrome c oxidase subunit 1
MDWQVAVGATILTVALFMFFVVFIGSWGWGEKADKPVDDHIPEPLSGAEHSPKILDNMKLWTGVAIVLVILAYTFPLYEMVIDGLFSPGAPASPV